MRSATPKNFPDCDIYHINRNCGFASCQVSAGLIFLIERERALAAHAGYHPLSKKPTTLLVITTMRFHRVTGSLR
jgi:hypothetical protein